VDSYGDIASRIKTYEHILGDRVAATQEQIRRLKKSAENVLHT
jgi:hypothetical protein